MDSPISNLLSSLTPACEACVLIASMSSPGPIEDPTPPPPDPDEPPPPPENPEAVKVELQRKQNAQKSDPNVCCAQTGEELLGTRITDASRTNTNTLTDAGIDPLYCLECCGKAPEAYWWDSLKICPKSKCELLSCVKNGVIENIFFFYSTETIGLELPQKTVINGKLYTLDLLAHHSVTDAYGARLFKVPNGTDRTFYTGGNTI
jgi:hypothetical protein